MGAGRTMPRNDNGHPAQPMHSTEDGRTVAGCSNSVGIRFPGRVSRSTWRGFTFDRVTRARIRAPFDGEKISLKHKVTQHHGQREGQD
jgi:hypothetical protein